jgi:hypothetical protein
MTGDLRRPDGHERAIDNPNLTWDIAIMRTPAAVREWLSKIGKRGGSIGGRSTSRAKAAAARQNGKLGGRPRVRKGERE